VEEAILRCMHAGGKSAAPSAGASPVPPQAQPTPPPSINQAIRAIDDLIISELKEVIRHKDNAAAERQRAQSNRDLGNSEVAAEQERSAAREEARAKEIEAEIRGKEKSKRAVEKFL
jgi:hypothetical protein